MKRNLHMLWGALVLSIVLYFLHSLANALYLYWAYWWYDVLMHFTTGFTVALLVYWVLYSSGFLYGPVSRSFWRAFVPVFIIVILIALSWEWFEFAFNITDSHEGYILDTLNDLLLATLGTALATAIGLRQSNG